MALHFHNMLLVALVASTTAAGAQTVREPPPSHVVSGRRIDSAFLRGAVRTLSAPEMEGRRTGTPGGRKARAWVLNQFERIGLPPAGAGFLLPFRFKTGSGDVVDGANIAATCAGTNPDAKTIVVSAHYDHVGVRDGQIYPGADDNASGVAVLLDIARMCRERPFQHTVVFVAFDAEEQGLQGAKAFVAKPPNPLDRIALNVNLDMVARGDKGELYAAGTHHYPALRPALESEASQTTSIKLLFGHDRPGTGSDDWTHQSDHGVFHDAGIPFIYFGVEDHPDYHKPTDTADKIDLDFFGNAADTVVDAVVALDAALIGLRR